MIVNLIQMHFQIKNPQTTRNIHYTLRIAVAMCFIGHGAFGIITKPIWCNYFGVFGIGRDLAYKIMPVVGSVDILFGIVMLVFPVRALLVWLVIWGILTASLRPLSGEPFAELIERAGNFGAPLALLILSGGIQRNGKNLFSRMNPGLSVNTATFSHVVLCLRIVVFLLLAGHGWLNLIEKKGIISQYTSLGFGNPSQVAYAVGIFEIVTAFMILLRPLRPIVFMLICWKMASELFYPHYELFEWVERGGSYGTLLAFWLSLGPGHSHMFSSLFLRKRRRMTENIQA